MTGRTTDTPTALVLNAAARVWPKDTSVVFGRKVDAVLRHAGTSSPSTITIAEADQALAVLERIQTGELQVFLRTTGEYEIRRAPKKPTPRKPFRFRGRSE